MKNCPKCNKNKDLSEFYITANRPKGSAFCKSCSTKYSGERWIQKKIAAIKYKGSQCEDCQLHLDNSHYAVFEFHHLDPTQKDMDWGKMRLTSTVKINKELDKCALLCANCHRIRHIK